MWVLRITCSSVQGTRGRAESCLYQAHPPHYLCLSGSRARHQGMGAGRQQAPAATTIAQHRLDRLSVCGVTAAVHIVPLQNAFLHKYLPMSTGWLGMFTGCFLFCSLFPRGMKCGE